MTEPDQAGRRMSGMAVPVAALALVVAIAALIRTDRDAPTRTTTAGIARGTAGPRASTLKLQSQLLSTPLGASPDGKPGSQMVFTGMLFTPKGAAAIGQSQGACTRTAPGRGQVFECQLTFVFRGGEIHGQSVSSYQGPADGVVTGGTRHYANIRGTFAYQATGKPRVNLTFALLSER